MTEEHNDDPIDFNSPAERERWSTIYERTFERSNNPWDAADTATADMMIRRRAFPLAHGRIGYVDALQLAHGALMQVRSHVIESSHGARDPSGALARRVAELDGLIGLINKHTSTGQ